MNTSHLTKEAIFARLKTVIDPELNVDVVSLGLVYDVTITTVQTPEGERPRVHILFTLTTPGCPLASVFDSMLRDALRDLPDLDADTDVAIELTFDPPWVPDMMTEEARAELGFD
jgi:metal-sulfur cluster biosynthetic enzyme